jgi:hypothetical protein
MSAQVELTVLFVFWRLFLALAIADSFALARRACNNSFVSDVADSPWLGLHRISHSDAVPFMPDETTNENSSLENDSFSTETRKQTRKRRRKRLENATVNVAIEVKKLSS